MEADFSGWATKYNVLCSDGRTIMPGAFSHQDKQTVPLVWQHGHTDPKNVLGHAVLQARQEGVYVDAFFNDSEPAQHAKGLVTHKDIKHQSIWANKLVERQAKVLRGEIREVSLVISGANPEALIENITISHGDEVEIVDDTVIIHSGLELSVDDGSVEHAEGDTSTTTTADGDETVQDIYDTLSEKQKGIFHFMLSQLTEPEGAEADKADTVQQDDLNGDDNNKEGTPKMTNVFEQADKSGGQATVERHVLSHDDMKEITTSAARSGSLKHAVEEYALAHGITNIESLFPEAKAITAAPEFFARRMEWVNVVLGGVNKRPFSRIKTHYADLNFDEARAKGYIKGNMKKEEFFPVASRETTPQTVYKKQKLDRDDILDITDFDVVVWMKGEMRVMLDEELARAILLGDGRALDDDDKINPDKIRPIATDDELYTVVVNVNIDDASSSYDEIVDAIVLARQHYRGSGLPHFFTTETTRARLLLIKDELGRRIYKTQAELETALLVSGISTVEPMDAYPDIVGVLVNLTDYSVGTDRGGQVTLFDDFDIDFNKYTYLIETRMSGALTKLKSAQVIMKVASGDELVVPNPPTFVASTGVVTVVATTGVSYFNDDTDVELTAGAQAALDPGETLVVRAEPDAGFYFASSEDDTWSFTRPEA